MHTDAHSIAALVGAPYRPALSPLAERGLALQGFDTSNRSSLRLASPWLRVAPAASAALAASGAALRSDGIFWWLAVVAWIGAFGPGHPFDLPQAAWARWAGGPPLTEYPAPRRFAAAVAGGWSVAAAMAFQAGAESIGVAMGLAVAVLGGLCAGTHLCAGAWVWRLLGR